MDQQQVLPTTREPGAYIKVGHKVTIWGRVSLTNNGSSSGQASFGGLPFTIADVVATTGIDGGGHMTYQNNISGIYGPIVLSAEDGGTHVDFRAATTTNGNMATAILRAILTMMVISLCDYLPDHIKRKGYILIPKPVSFGERP